MNYGVIDFVWLTKILKKVKTMKIIKTCSCDGISLQISVAFLSLIILLITALYFTQTPKLYAATIDVNTTADVEANDGECALREAIIAANDNAASGAMDGECAAGDASPTLDTINVPAGAYDLAIDSQLNPDEDDLTINGAGNGNNPATDTIIDASGITDRILLIESSDFTINDIRFTGGNSVMGGGCIYVDPNEIDVVFHKITVDNCDADNGGGIYIDSSAEVLIELSTISNNFAQNGAGIKIVDDDDGTDSEITIDKTTINDNNTDMENGDGGGIHIESGSDDPILVITNSTISGNSAHRDGGGLYLVNGNITINNTTIGGDSPANGNLADSDSSGSANGGGLFIDGGATVTISNSIIANNDDGSPAEVHPDCYREGILISGGHNLIGNNTTDNGCDDFDNGDKGDIVGGDNGGDGDPISPGLGQLTDNGGCNLTHALLAGSPAIGNGNPRDLDIVDCENEDQREEARPPFPIPCDIGAYQAVDADLSITKEANESTVDLDDDIVYTITVTNNGPAQATGVVITDLLPSGITFVSAPGCNAPLGGVLTCSIGTLAPGASAIITLKLNVPNNPALIGTIISNTASASAIQNDPLNSNDSDTEIVVVRGVDLSVTKTDDADPVLVGDQITYTIIVTNNGPSTATDVILTDNLTSNVSFDSVESTVGSCSLMLGTVTCDLGDLLDGEQAVITLEVTVTDPLTIVNEAVVTTTETESDSSNNSDTEFTSVSVPGFIPDPIPPQLDIDGNGDMIPDNTQPNVFSVNNSVDGQPVTFVVPGGLEISVTPLQDPMGPVPPSGVDTPVGCYEIIIEGALPDLPIPVDILLPPGTNVNTFYKFGPRPSNTTFEWYEFLFNDFTGAEIFPEENRIRLTFIDSQRGDSDLLVNGVIIDPGCPASVGSGGGSGCSIAPIGATSATLPLYALVAIAFISGRIWFRRRRSRDN